ncbi:hypothetical protein BC941DRAFT_456933 [Chlamydoabsidia padenii]|nr:hypothetical protein BC941DRAFT_456933 [Chlamydoabsidia padenii]
MQIKIFSAAFLLFNVLTTVMGDQGNSTQPGLGLRKQAVLNNGGGTLELAIAMLETNTMTTNYTYGDGKTGDAANFGIFKQGWFMIRSSTEEFKQYNATDYKKGTILNTNLKEDIKIRQESEKFYGIDKWFGGHRNGETGLNNPDTQDIANYKNAVFWIQKQIESDHKYLSDDTRFWVDVVPI